MSQIGDFQITPANVLAEAHYWDAKRKREDQEFRERQAASAEPVQLALRACEWRIATSVNKKWEQQYEYHSGVFHGWTGDGSAIVEKPDGWTTSVSQVRFTDRVNNKEQAA